MAVERLSILVVDDEEGYAKLVARHLAGISNWQITTTIHTQASAAIECLKTEPFDLAILDYALGDRNGVELLHVIRRAGILCPVIALTGRGSESIAAEFLRAGADDYLIKTTLTQADLATAIEKAIARHEYRMRYDELAERDGRVETMSQQLADATLQLTKLSRLDQLTQVLNRAAWLEALGLEHDRAVRYGSPYALLMVDIDHFKRLNDSQGHLAGDECLRRLAHVFIDACRGTDLIGRYGGEEFAILAPETDFEGGLTIAHRVRQGTVDANLANPGLCPSGVVTVSVGVAAGPRGGWEHVLQSADDALYDAKNGGRNRVCGRNLDAQGRPRRIQVSYGKRS